ncbi:hypothetical protein [Bacillus sp. AFS017336]|uniref:hypothetical protein n=1 Tax=Bacillus sp. AFS017336 TaxID=2033489 RepID=UPI000BF16B87|nr:hypothetical protein [Bacillus sp. AFS017336]PEL14293.1 hypothetical protein CN601_01755 [Bacillus sp. AFS017336]
MIINVDGYKMIFFLENLIREYISFYSNIDDMNVGFKERLKEIALANGEDNVESYETLLKYSHIGELVDFVKSKKFKQKKYNYTEKTNVSVLIKHRNNIMHSRSITSDEMEQITVLCNKFIKGLEDGNYETKWNIFLTNDINEFNIPRVFIEYPVGKNFDRLIGRSKELKELKFEITKPTPVSIIGHGGLGKTALVLQLIEDLVNSPDQPFEKIYFMSFKNTVFEHGAIRRFEKVISNHKDLIFRMASFMDIDISEKEFCDIEELVWKEIFSTKSLLILDNLETETVKSNLSEFTGIAQKFINNFTKPSRLIITSRYGLGDREAKLPLFQFNLENTKDLIESYLNAEILYEKKITLEDWEWIQKYTEGNPGLIIAFCNTLKSTRKELLDIRVGYDTVYSTVSSELHDQREEFIVFCFENTIESMAEGSQIFLSILCYICSEANISEINEEFLTYLRNELGLKKLGEHNLRSTTFTNIGFLQPIPSSDKYYVNELYIEYMDGNYSTEIFNVFKLKDLEWYPKLEELKDRILEIQFDEEVSLGKLLSELYLSIYKKNGDKKYLINSFFCEPDLDKLLKIFTNINDTELVSHIEYLDKVQNQLKNQSERSKQEQIIIIVLRALLSINKKILSRKIIKIRQRDLFKFYEHMEKRIPILKKGEVNIDIKTAACKLLTILKEYDKVDSFTHNEPRLVKQRFNSYTKQVGDLSGKNREECLKYINKCKEILKLHPRDIDSYLRAQFNLYSSRYFKKDQPEEALKLLNNYEQYFTNSNTQLFIFTMESLLIRMECLMRTGGDISEINLFKERFRKYTSMEEYQGIFNSKKDSIEQSFNHIKQEIEKYERETHPTS